MKMDIRIDCYLAVLEKFRKKYPDAHFEVITNTSKSILSPSKELLVKAGIYKKPDGTRNPRWEFDRYADHLEAEILQNPEALKRIRELKDIARYQKKTVFLVCYEKDPSKCHRSLIKKIMGYTCRNCEFFSCDEVEEDPHDSINDPEPELVEYFHCDATDEDWDLFIGDLEICTKFQEKYEYH